MKNNFKGTLSFLSEIEREWIVGLSGKKSLNK